MVLLTFVLFEAAKVIGYLAAFLFVCVTVWKLSDYFETNLWFGLAVLGGVTAAFTYYWYGYLPESFAGPAISCVFFGILYDDRLQRKAEDAGREWAKVYVAGHPEHATMPFDIAVSTVLEACRRAEASKRYRQYWGRFRAGIYAGIHDGVIELRQRSWEEFRQSRP